MTTHALDDFVRRPIEVFSKHRGELKMCGGGKLFSFAHQSSADD